ncbi:HAD family phosphatase [Brachyspira pilosicoli]|uniref:HAD family hydrolase n=1 Tax=Brachyspira pilosicoli TaxID=52584 RepID=UPI003003E8B9
MNQKIKAAIFDFDGTLVDSESIYTKALTYTAQTMNKLTDVDFSAMAGSQTNDIKKMLIEKNYIIPDNFFEEAETYFHKIIETDLETFDGAIEILEKFKNIDIVIASNSNINYVRRMSEKKSIAKYIVGYSCYNENLRAKPEPDLFLNAFEILKKRNNNITKDDVIVFEDSLVGIEGAKKAGMKIVAITNTYQREILLKHGADIVVDRIDEALNYLNV